MSSPADIIKDASLRSRMQRNAYKWFNEKKPGAVISKREQWLSALIVISMLSLVLETVPALQAYQKWFNAIELICIFVFSCEYGLRLYIAPEDPQFSKYRYPRLRYMISFFALIDILAILPFFLGSLIAVDLVALRVLRLLKILRIFIPAVEEFRRLNKGRTFRQHVHALTFQSEYGGALHHYFDIFIVFWVLISVLAVILETVDSIFYNVPIEFLVLDTIAVLIFSIEYLMRLYACVEDPSYKKKTDFLRLRHATQPSSIVDLLAILPFFLEFLLHNVLDLRFLRTFRLLRLFKLARYTGATNTLFSIIRREMPTLFASAFTLVLLVILMASLGYLFEHAAQPDKFENIPTAIYWAVITLASVGYGDISPITPMGRLMTTLMAFIGLGLFAVPASILASAFMQELQAQKQAIENAIYTRLADGNLSEEEYQEVHARAQLMNIAPEQVNILIEKAKRETEERNKRDLFVSAEFLVQHPEIAVGQFHLLYQQISRITSLPNVEEISRRVMAARDIPESEKAVWKRLREISSGSEK